MGAELSRQVIGNKRTFRTSEMGRERQFRLADDDACFLVGALECLEYPFFR